MKRVIRSSVDQREYVMSGPLLNMVKQEFQKLRKELSQSDRKIQSKPVKAWPDGTFIESHRMYDDQTSHTLQVEYNPAGPVGSNGLAKAYDIRYRTEDGQILDRTDKNVKYGTESGEMLADVFDETWDDWGEEGIGLETTHPDGSTTDYNTKTGFDAE